MEKEVKEFYEKDIAYNRFFKKKKKISFDINEELLQRIDELASLSKNSRTVIINALLGQGMVPFINYLENTWKELLTEGKYGKIKKDMEKLLQDLKKLKEKYNYL
jgi:predicted transcriptional regulator